MLGAVVLSKETLEPIIIEMAQKYSIDPAWIKAHIKAESNWDVNASRYEAHKGDASWGLMQLLLKTAQDVLGNPSLNTTQLMQPRINIEAGAKFLSQLYARYGSMSDAAAAYNAGSPRFLADGRTYVNQAYVDKVLKNYNIYSALGSGIVAEAAINVEEALTPSEDTVPIYLILGVGLLGLVIMTRD